MSSPIYFNKIIHDHYHLKKQELAHSAVNIQQWFQQLLKVKILLMIGYDLMDTKFIQKISNQVLQSEIILTAKKIMIQIMKSKIDQAAKQVYLV